MKSKIASHRGGSLLWPENSQTAFENTSMLPVEQVEFDIHQTKDDRVVVLHDACLERCCNTDGYIEDYTWPELKKMTLAGTENERPLLMEEVVEIFKTSCVDLRMEIKPGRNMIPYKGLEEKAIQILNRGGMAERTTITSFFLDILEQVSSLDETFPRLWLISPIVERCLGSVRLLKIIQAQRQFELSFNIDYLTEELLISFVEKGYTVGAWACHTEEAIRKAFSIACSVFTSDDPVLALKIRNSL